MQPGAFVKWRELSAALELPRTIVNRLNARTASIVFSGRNLKLWTKYRGTDPESDFTATNGTDTPSEFQTFAAPSVFQLRVNIGY
jgi:hypothetical protein